MKTVMCKAEPVCWISEYALRRIQANDGILAKMSFPEGLSLKANSVQNVPLFTLDQIATRQAVGRALRVPGEPDIGEQV